MTIETQHEYEKSSREPSSTMELIRADIVSLRRGFSELFALARAGLRLSDSRAAAEMSKNRMETFEKLGARTRAAGLAVKPSASADGMAEARVCALTPAPGTATTR